MTDNLMGSNRRLIVILSTAFYFDLLLVILLNVSESVSPFKVWSSFLVIMVGVAAGLYYILRFLFFASNFVQVVMDNSGLESGTDLDFTGLFGDAIKRSMRPPYDFVNRESVDSGQGIRTLTQMGT